MRKRQNDIINFMRKWKFGNDVAMFLFLGNSEG